MRLIKQQKGSAILSVIVLAGVVATAGYLGLNSYKNKIDGAKKDKLAQQSSLYVNKLESRVTDSCQTLFPPSAWKNNPNINSTAVQDKVLIQNTLKDQLGLQANESIKITNDKVLSNHPEGKLVELTLSFEKNTVVSHSQKIKLFVKSNVCSSALKESDSIKTFCESSGAATDAGACRFSAKETVENSLGDYERQTVQKNMSETLCQLKFEAGNASNRNGAVGCENKQYGCYLQTGHHIQNTANYQEVITKGESSVSSTIDSKRKEVIRSQTFQIASQFQRFKTYVEDPRISIGNNTFLDNLLGLYGLEINAGNSLVGTGTVGTNLGFAGLGAGAGIGVAALVGASLGPGAVIGVPVAILLALILKCPKERKIITNYSCSRGTLAINAMRIEKKKFRCWKFGCGCRWRNEKNLESISKRTIADVILGNMSYENPVQTEDGDDDVQEFITSAITSIQMVEILSELYNLQDESGEGSVDLEAILALDPSIGVAFQAKEEQLWTHQITRIQSIDTEASDAQQQLDNIIAEIESYMDAIRDLSIKNLVEQVINQTQNEINS